VLPLDRGYCMRESARIVARTYSNYMLVARWKADARCLFVARSDADQATATAAASRDCVTYRAFDVRVPRNSPTARNHVRMSCGVTNGISDAIVQLMSVTAGIAKRC
jgi:hypothetical protein